MRKYCILNCYPCSVTSSNIEQPPRQLHLETFDARLIPLFISHFKGKPVFTRHGSGDKLAPLMGVLLALVSFVHDRNDTLRHMIAGQHKFVFVARPPLIMVAVCSTTESIYQVRLMILCYSVHNCRL